MSNISRLRYFSSGCCWRFFRVSRRRMYTSRSITWPGISVFTLFYEKKKKNYGTWKYFTRYRNFIGWDMYQKARGCYSISVMSEVFYLCYTVLCTQHDRTVPCCVFTRWHYELPPRSCTMEDTKRDFGNRNMFFSKRYKESNYTK